MTKNIISLCRIQLKQEMKNRNGIYGIILYVLSSVFVVYMAVKEINDSSVWVGLFWVIQLFSCLNAASKSFQYSKGRDLYFYQLSGPRPFILSKMIFNLILMNLVFLLSQLIFSLMMGNPFENTSSFIILGTLGTSALSSLLTMMSAITFKADNNYTLMAILSLPIMIPLLIVLVQSSNDIIDGSNIASISQNLYILGGLNLMIISLAYTLFPYLCTD